MDLLKVASLKSMLYVMIQRNLIEHVSDGFFIGTYVSLKVTDIELTRYGLDNRYEFRIFSTTPCGYATRITDVRIIIDNDYLRNNQEIYLLAAFAYLHGMGEADDVSEVAYDEGSLCKFVYGNHMGKEIKINFEIITTKTYY